MREFDCRAKDRGDLQRKHRVYFTSHPEDFPLYFDKISTDILATHDCAIYYTTDMSRPIKPEGGNNPLGSMSLFVVPITMKLLVLPNRAMQSDIEFAKKNGIPILPFMMETGDEIIKIYEREDNFGKRQFINPLSLDETEIKYRDKLKKYLDSMLIKNELIKEVREAFYAQIFLSYRKKDRAYANRLMEMIHGIPGCENLSIWYDEFIVFGEDWRESIFDAMKESSMFTLLVTPNLLEEKNFVMNEEYPRARERQMDILPVRMCDMSEDEKNTLVQRLVPSTIIAPEDEAFKERFLDTLTRAAIEKSEDERHNFLIGLAYLDGIGVEIDRTRGMELILGAAESGVAEAIEKLIDHYGCKVERHNDYLEGIKWRKRLLDTYKKKHSRGHERVISAMELLRDAYAAIPTYETELVELLSEIYELKCEGLDEAHPDRLAAVASIVFWNHTLYKRITGDDPAPTLLSRIRSPECEANDNLFDELFNIVFALSSLGDHGSALTWERAILDLKCRTLPEGDARILTSKKRVADLLLLNDDRGAMEAFEEAYVAYCNAYGRDSEKTVVMQVELGKAYFRFKDQAMAKKIFETALSASEARFGREHSLVTEALYHLARTNIELEYYAVAKEQLSRVCEWRKTYIGSADEKTVTAYFYLAKAYFLSGDYVIATIRLKESADMISGLIKANTEEFETSPNEESLMAEVYSMLADCNVALKNYKEAYRWQKRVVDYEYSCDFTGESEEIKAAEAKLRDIKKSAEGAG